MRQLIPSKLGAKIERVIKEKNQESLQKVEGTSVKALILGRTTFTIKGFYKNLELPVVTLLVDALNIIRLIVVANTVHAND